MPSAIQMFQLPSAIALSIAATRMHRGLTDFVHGTTHVYDIEVFNFFPFHILTIFYDDSIVDPAISTKAVVKAQGHIGICRHLTR